MKKKTLIYSGIGLALLAVAAWYFTRKQARQWRFEDNYFSNGGTLGFIGKNPPPFTTGDMVTVNQDPGAKYKSYNGQTSVTDVYQIKEGNKTYGNKYVVEVATPRKGDTGVNPGAITG